MAEITVWVAAIYLAICLLTSPPRGYYFRTTDYTAKPPIILSELPRPGYDRFDPYQSPLRLLPDFRLRSWKGGRDQGSGGFNHYWEVVYHPDVPRMCRWLASVGFV